MEITKAQLELEERKEGKDLYSYQKGAIDKIFTAFEESPEDYHLLYQLPTGGGKTVIFSEIVRQYLKHHKKKVLVMTHRIELCKQTSNMLTEFGVTNKVVDSKANLDDQDEYSCFVAMVETLNNRLIDNKFDVSDIGLVIIDGIADLVADVNSLPESNEIIQKLMSWSTQSKAHIIVVIHSNYGSNKATGHLGSAIMKKAETVCQLEREDDFTKVTFPFCRGFKIDEFCFRLDENGLPYTTSLDY